MIRAVTFLFLAALSAGCIHHREGTIQPTQATKWTHGVTTRRDVVAAWGNPHATAGDTWIWRERTSNGGKIKAAYKGIGMTIANAAVATREHRVRFDGKGKLLDFETSDSVPRGARWSIWPW